MSYTAANVFPDLVIEVLSPSTRRMDLTLKLQKYRDAQVKEYWIADPEDFQVMIYDLTDMKFPKIYDFTDDIPVILSGGECTVTLRKIANDPFYAE